MLFKTAVIGLGVANLVVLSAAIVVASVGIKRFRSDVQAQMDELRAKANKTTTKIKAVFEALED